MSVFSIDGYSIGSYNCRANKKRGGSVILVDNDTKQNIEELKFCKDLYKLNSFETCGVRDLNTNLNIICVYRTPDDKNFDVFISQLERLLEHFFNKKCLIVGDFNVNMLRENKYQRDLITLLKCYNFTHLINESTFIRNNAESCIDNIFTNLNNENLESCDIDHNMLADGHAGLWCGVTVESNNGRKAVEYYNAFRRSFSEKNKNIFRHSLTQSDLGNSNVNNFLKCFTKLFQRSFKKRKVKVKTKMRHNINWITRGIRTSSKMKRFLTSINKSSCHEPMISYRNNYIRIYRRVINLSKRNSVKREVENAKNSSKQIWNIVNRQRNKSRLGTFVNYRLKINNDIIDNIEDIADIFLNQFDHSANNNNSDNNSHKEQALTFLEKNCNRVNNDMEFSPTNKTEIRVIVKRMATKHSYGYDEIPIITIKDNIDILAQPLCNFFNSCISSGIFPEQLKIARIIPVHKKGVKNDPKNFRPISLLPVLSKIYENIIKNRLVLHLKKYDILNERQFGYKTGVGTNDAVDLLINDVVCNLSCKKKVAGIFLDLSSAFDLVDHDILLAKLQFYGVRGETLCLFKSYLSNRKQFVELKEIDEGQEVVIKSRVVNVTRGVPQGSILGPIFFIIFLNDLINFMTNSIADIKLVVYADDTNAVVPASCLNELEMKVNGALDLFNTWFYANNLKVNIEKTQAILFKTTVQKREKIDIVCEGNRLELTKSVKFLGVHIDELLNWKDELTHIDNTISSACYALRSLRDEVTVAQLVIVYYALVESKLRYSVRFWGNSYAYNMNRAFILQKRAIRTIVRIPPWESCKEYFKNLGVLTVPSLYILVTLMDIVKNPDKYETNCQRELRLNTRRKDLEFVSCLKLKVAQHASRYQAVKLFNILPTDMKKIDCPRKFKSTLMQLLLKGCFYSVEEFFRCKFNEL